jgi:hypothetical protein
MVPAVERNRHILNLIDQNLFFVIHAPRQSGKTTVIDALTEKINNGGLYYALTVSLYAAHFSREIDKSFDFIFDVIYDEVQSSSIPEIASLADGLRSYKTMTIAYRIRNMLRFLCNSLDRELIVFFDEADAMPESVILPFLDQIRDGYVNRYKRNKKFPKSLILIGMRDIVDYRTEMRSNGYSAGTSSPFNIGAESLSLPDFTVDEICSLYRQHTEATGQVFDDSAIERTWHWTEGQPWLVNALAYLIINNKLCGDYSQNICGNIVDETASDLIIENRTHFRSLAERLKEPRVLMVMDAVISGISTIPKTVFPDDIRYCTDLGLLKPGPDGIGSLRPSNPIYQEVILRILSSGILQNKVPIELASKWMDGTVLHMSSLLRKFQEYWIENAELTTSESLIQIQAEPGVVEAFSNLASVIPNAGQKEQIFLNAKVNLANMMKESFCVLVLFSFLQRVLNGGAKISREFALNRKSVDIMATYKGKRYPIEVKIKGNMSRRQSLEQLQGYIDMCNATEGWLVVFDRGTSKTLKEKSSWEVDSGVKSTKYIVNF